MSILRTFSRTLAGVIVSSALLHAQTTLPTKSISIFKNGSCMITKEGTLPLKDNSLRLPVPNAIHSTYWISTPGERLIKSVQYKSEITKVQRDVASLIDLLELNIGKSIHFDLVRYASASINSMSPISEPRVSLSSTSVSGKILGINRSMNTFKIDDKNGIRYFDCGVLKDANYSIADAVDTKQVDSTARYAIVKPTKSLSEMRLQEISLQNGIQWIPSYHLSLLGAKELRIEMKALVENFSSEDIREAETEVVVGVPQLYFSSLLDPAVYDSYTQIAPANPAMYKNVYANRAESLRGARSVASDASMESLAIGSPSYNISYEADAEAANDIFVYKIGSLSLEKNTKASYQIFATTVDYKDIHECEIPDAINFEANRIVPTRDDSYDVFHSIDIHNTSGYPLTTAGGVVTDEKGRFLAQDMLKYIPKGGHGRLRLAKAINVTLKNSEEELSRMDNVKKLYKINYGKASIKGTVVIDNFDDKELSINVKKHVNGSVVNSANGKVKKQSQLYGINPQSEISWTITIPAGEHREISYEYESVYRQ